MIRQSTIRASLAIAAVTCLAALVFLVPAAPAAPDAGKPGGCGLRAWTHVLTGHWGGSCR